MRLWLSAILLIGILASCQERQKNVYTIGFSQCTGDDEWRRSMLNGMRRELSFYPNARLIYKDAKANSRKQIEQIKALMSEGVDLLIISPNESDPVTPIVEEAYKQGIPVVIVDRRTSSAYYTAYVGGDNYEVGKVAGLYIARLLKGKGKVIEIAGLPTSSPASARHKGLTDAFAAYPNLKLVKTVNGGWEKPIAKKALEQQLQQHSDVDLVFAQNEVMALGAYEVFKERGWGKKVKIVGVDGLPGPLGDIQMVYDGIIDASALYPTGGEEAIRVAMNILRKEHFQKENLLQTAIIDSTNVRMIKLQTDKIIDHQNAIERQQKRIDDQINIYANQSNLLYLMTALFVAAILFGTVALYSSFENKKINKELKIKNEQILLQRNQIQEIAEKAQEATETKFRFFTNISHEFRTPLTLILGPLEDLLQVKNQTNSIRKNLILIQKNAQRLLWLVNQLMDFRKIESGKIQLRVTENDMVAFLRELMLPFEYMAVKRKIDFRMLTNLRTARVWFDTDMMDKVMFNLLSNAFKFTSDGGRIYIYVELHSDELVIKVEDNGTGMTVYEKEQAFEMFYQGADSTKGTGLGLPLSREFIELHQGSINVTSQKGEGAVFEIKLRLGDSHLREEDKAGETVNWSRTYPHFVTEAPDSDLFAAPKDTALLPTILLIEDNQDLREFLQLKLKSEFTIIDADEGNQGLAEAFNTVPDLILCDVMLPGMDGLKIASILKADLRTSHIPIVLLTAKSSIEQQIAGMQSGVDLYITKPFSPGFLLESIRSLLANREILRGYFIGDESNEERSALTMSNLDKKFLSNLKAVVLSKLSDSSLSVDSLAVELGLSRVQLFRKVKALLGYSINEYIQSMRLNKARHLLERSDESMSEIAYQAGFASATYFSTAFKSKYQLSPKDYRSKCKA
ncbi:substrate-binding domain-containing protein [Larkinella arboricola]